MVPRPEDAFFCAIHLSGFEKCLGRVDLYFGTDIHISLKVNHHFNDPLYFHIDPLLGQILLLMTKYLQS